MRPHLALLGLLVTVSSPAAADKATAARHLDAGNAKLAAGDAAGAAELYERAYAEYASPKILFNWAEALWKASRGPEAWAIYRRFVDEARAPELARNVAVAKSNLATLRRGLGELSLRGVPADARVEIDGRPAIRDGALILMEPGRRAVIVHLPERAPVATSLEVRAGRRIRFDVPPPLVASLPPPGPAAAEPAPPSEASPPDPEAALVATGPGPAASETGGSGWFGRWGVWVAVGVAAVTAAAVTAAVVPGRDFVPDTELGQTSTAQWERP